MNEFFGFFAMLLIAHALADYPLQGDFLAVAKNPWQTRIPDITWEWAMGSHCLIQGGFVWFVTGVWWLGALEFVLHGAIDLAKCRGHISFSEDQFAHVACKLVWAALAVLAGVAP